MDRNFRSSRLTNSNLIGTEGSQGTDYKHRQQISEAYSKSSKSKSKYKKIVLIQFILILFTIPTVILIIPKKQNLLMLFGFNIVGTLFGMLCGLLSLSRNNKFLIGTCNVFIVSCGVAPNLLLLFGVFMTSKNMTPTVPPIIIILAILILVVNLYAGVQTKILSSTWKITTTTSTTTATATTTTTSTSNNQKDQ